MEEIMSCGIYKITNILTGEMYIGASKDLKKRLWAHRNKYSNIKEIIEKYGVENFTFEVIEECLEEELSEKEEEYIELYDSRNKGYNISKGGERGNTNTTGYYRVHKDKNKKYVQGYLWRYHYFENGKHKSIRRMDLNKLKEEVLARGLKWEILDEENAKKSDEENEQAIIINNHHVKNNTGLYRVSKCKTKPNSNNIIYRYQYDHNGKFKQISSADLIALEKKVKDSGLPWKIIDENKTELTYEEFYLHKNDNTPHHDTGLYNVRKIKSKNFHQGYTWKYKFYEDSVEKSISRIDLIDLKKEVEKRNLKWCITDAEKAEESFKQNSKCVKNIKDIIYNTSGFYHVFKEKTRKGSQGFTWVYHYTDSEGKKKKIRRVNLNDLKEEVLSKGLKWEVIDNEVANKTLDENCNS